MKKIDLYFLITVLVMLFYFTLVLIWINHLPANLAEKAVTNQCPIDHHEYQIELEFDTVLIYQDNRFVGSYIVTEPLSPIDSILGDDNR